MKVTIALLRRLVQAGYDAEGYGPVCPVCEALLSKGRLHVEGCELVAALAEAEAKAPKLLALDLRAMAARLAQTADELLHEPRLTSPQTRLAEAFVALVRDLGRLLDLIDDRAMSQDQARELWERTEKLAEVETALASAREEIARLTAERDRGGDLAAELRAIAAEALTAARTIPGLADVFETRAAGIVAALALATERMAAKGGAR